MVIVGIDQREQARDALNLGQVLAHLMGERLLVAWVHPYERLPSLLAEDSAGQAVREAVEEIASSIRESLPAELRIELRTVAGRSPAAGLLGLAEREGARLIVVGPSARGGLGRVLPGATARRLLSGSPVPVAVAPVGYRNDPGEVRTVGIAFDGGEESSVALNWAAQLADRAEAGLRISAVHSSLAFPNVSASGAFPIESVNQALRRELRGELEKAAKRVDSRLNPDVSLTDGDPTQVLLEQSNELDLLVLGSRGYGPLRGVLVGSVSGAVAEGATCPVVVTPRSTSD